MADEPGTGATDAQKRDTWVVAAAVFAATAMLTTLIAVGLAFRYADEESGSTSVATGPPVEFDIELGDIFVSPAQIEVPAGSEVILHITNVGEMQHDLVTDDGKGTAMLEPGESETVTFGPFSSSTVAWCTVPGHREAGMELAIAVTGGDGAGHGDHAAGPGTSGSGSGAQIDFNATPGNEWVPFDPVLAPAPGGTEHVIEMSAEETVLEVAPGVTQEMWTFDQQFPGPVLRGKVGDLFTVTITNNGEIAHSMDFHSSKVAPNVEMRNLQPGESVIYQFEAKHAGVWMYHCGTAPALHHVGNGMFGAMIVDPPDLPPVDHEFVFVQSEIYTGPMGEPGDYDKMWNEEWDAVVFNGYVNQYMHAPIRVEPNERIRAWVLDAGPSENSSFHIIGTIFDTVYKEGVLLLSPDETRGGSQALDLQPAQGGYVEFTFDVPGIYTMVTHKFANVGKGALGTFVAGDVDADPMGH